jgi:hypothetical protein
MHALGHEDEGDCFVAVYHKQSATSLSSEASRRGQSYGSICSHQPAAKRPSGLDFPYQQTLSGWVCAEASNALARIHFHERYKRT